jgi:hypothetical protein
MKKSGENARENDESSEKRYQIFMEFTLKNRKEWERIYVVNVRKEKEGMEQKEGNVKEQTLEIERGTYR